MTLRESSTNDSRTGVKHYRILLFVTIMIFSFFIPCQGATFYVSLDGNDSWSGTLDVPNETNTDGPFATFSSARDAVKNLKKSGYTSDIQVLIRGGTYLIENAIAFTIIDSGGENQTITYAAYPGEAVTIERWPS